MYKTTHLALVLLTCLLQSGAWAQALYARTFGKKSDTPVVFLHGGPGYNAANFEATTAQALADRGFYVLVYDRRGEGRSADAKAAYTFEQTVADLDSLCRAWGLVRPVLIGHSFGGMVATKYAETQPGGVRSIVLVGAPISLPASFRHIIESSEHIYAAKNDSLSLRYIATLKAADTTSYEYSTYCLSHAMQNGFYSPKEPTEGAKALYATFKTDTLLMKFAKKMSYQAPLAFWRNERYTTLDLSDNFRQLVRKGIPIHALYGKDDGLYSSQQVAALGLILGAEHLHYIDHCSHNVFIDRQEVFLEFMQSNINK
jgi:proline iminopeptidase